MKSARAVMNEGRLMWIHSRWVNSAAECCDWLIAAMAMHNLGDAQSWISSSRGGVGKFKEQLQWWTEAAMTAATSVLV